MPTRLAYIDEPNPQERHYDAVPEGVTFCQARVPMVDADANVVYIGTPDPDKKAQAHTDWARVKEKYEAERDSPHGNVKDSLEIKVCPEMDPDFSGGEPELQEIVGTRQANALNEAGYGTVEAARALEKEALLDIKGVGESTYEKLHD